MVVTCPVLPECLAVKFRMRHGASGGPWRRRRDPPRAPYRGPSREAHHLRKPSTDRKNLHALVDGVHELPAHIVRVLARSSSPVTGVTKTRITSSCPCLSSWHPGCCLHVCCQTTSSPSFNMPTTSPALMRPAFRSPDRRQRLDLAASFSGVVVSPPGAVVSPASHAEPVERRGTSLEEPATLGSVTKRHCCPP